MLVSWLLVREVEVSLQDDPQQSQLFQEMIDMDCDQSCKIDNFMRPDLPKEINLFMADERIWSTSPCKFAENSRELLSELMTVTSNEM